MKSIQVAITVVDGDKLMFDKMRIVSVEPLPKDDPMNGFVARSEGRKTTHIGGSEIGAAVLALLGDDDL